MLLLPQLATARVYMCVDEISGKTSFTDKACETSAVREEVRVQAANLDSGARSAAPAKEKTWRSQADSRKSGLDYSEERRSIYEHRATASTD
jgi:hypothetical protein